MKGKLFLLTVLVFFMSITINSTYAGKNENPASGDGMLIHVSSGPENPHKVLMALTLALKMSKNHNVLMFFDIEGVHVVLNKAKSIEHKDFGNSKNLVNELIEKGVKLIACPMCLKVVGKSQYDLIPGVEVAEEDDFFSFTSGRIVTLDY